MTAAFDPNRNNGTSSEPTPAELAETQLRELRDAPEHELEQLRSYVGYELRRRIAMGQLDHNTLLRDEVVDNAFASALDRLREGNPIRDLHTYLRSRAQDMIRREVRRLLYERRYTVSLDEVLSNADDDGEPVRLADILPDTEARELDEAAVDAETLTSLIESLSVLPERWRTVLLERTIQGKSAHRIANEHDLNVDEVRSIVVRSRDFLRDRMESQYQSLDVGEF